jgi:hypothetical protein
MQQTELSVFGPEFMVIQCLQQNENQGVELKVAGEYDGYQYPKMLI